MLAPLHNCTNLTAILSASKPEISVGAKHSGKQIIAENIVGANARTPLRSCFALRWFSRGETAVIFEKLSHLTRLNHGFLGNFF